jgi:putative ABC transport system permease protein
MKPVLAQRVQPETVRQSKVVPPDEVLAQARRPKGLARRMRYAGQMMVRGWFPRGYLFTVIGIAVGVAGLVALGAMAERIARFIQGGDRFVTGQISVAGAGMGIGAGFTAGGLLSSAKIAEIQKVPGVAAVQPQVMLPFNTSVSQFLTLTQELILGVDSAVPSPNRHYREMPVARGRFLQPGDRRQVVVGADFASSRKLGPGATLTLGGIDFTVLGVLERMLTAPDRFAIVPMDDARELWLRRDPLLVQVFGNGAGRLARGDLNSGAAVAWKDGEDPDVVARRILAEVPGVNVTIPSELSATLQASTRFFSALLLGIGTLGLVIGGLSLSNTVAASVFERIREFGIKRALGASDGQLLGEVLREALAVSLGGGALGVGLAVLVGALVDVRTLRDGQQLFYFSPRLLGFTAVFALLLGGVAGTYAALRILRLSPAEAVRRGS